MTNKAEAFDRERRVAYNKAALEDYRHRHARAIKHFGVSGTLEGHAPGLYIIEATSLENARRKLHPSVYQSPSRPRPWHLIEGLQEIRGSWAEVLSDTLDQIRNREKEYYTDLGNGVFYVEI